MEKSIVKKCKCPPGTRWIELGPETHNNYRVECLHCSDWIKWGKEAQLNELVDAGLDGEFVPYEPPAPRATLEKFFE